MPAESNQPDALDTQVSDKANETNAPIHDGILSFWIDLVELGEGKAPPVAVTLTLKGLLVTGEIVGHKEYLDGIGLMDVVTKFFGPTPERSYFEPRSYIHLKEAQFFFGADRPIPTEGGVLWRGRLSEVDGFSMGRMKTSLG